MADFASEIKVWPVPEAQGRKPNYDYHRREDYYTADRGREHRATDIYADEGEGVVAVFDGVAYEVKESGDWGKQVRIESADGNVVLYAHLSAQLVKKGQRVKAGDVIGHVGHSGFTLGRTGNHLHIEFWRSRSWLDTVDRWAELEAARVGQPPPKPPEPPQSDKEDNMRSSTAHGFGDDKAVMFGIAKDHSIYVTVAQDGENFTGATQLKKEDDNQPGVLHYFLSDRADYLGGGKFQAYAAVESNGVVSVWSPRINVNTGKGGIRRLPGDWSAV